MNETEIHKLNIFANDIQLNETVKGVIEREITKPTKDRDVQNLAARFLALEIIRDAWKEFDKFKDISNIEDNKKISYV